MLEDIKNGLLASAFIQIPYYDFPYKALQLTANDGSEKPVSSAQQSSSRILEVSLIYICPEWGFRLCVHWQSLPSHFEGHVWPLIEMQLHL